MSIILDALKKLDREKSSRRNRTANIAVEILKPELPRPEKRILRYFAAAALTAIVTAAATYAVVQLGFSSKSATTVPINLPAPGQQAALEVGSRESGVDARGEIKRAPSRTQDPGESKKPDSSSPPPDQGPADAKPAKAQAASAPVFRQPADGDRGQVNRAPAKIQDSGESKKSASSIPPPDKGPVDVKSTDRQGAPPPSSREPAGDVRGEIPRVPAKIQTQGEDKSLPLSSPPPGQGSVDTKSSTRQAPSFPVSRETGRESTPSGPAATPPAMKLSGIVWSSEPSERLAVINSMVVKEGATIEGVKVVEILPTSVRLFHNGKPFEISINLFGK
jgi:hypothetical protein